METPETIQVKQHYEQTARERDRRLRTPRLNPAQVNHRVRFRIINAFQEHLYKCYDKEDNFRGILYPGVGHTYTPQMWRETLRWLKKHL